MQNQIVESKRTLYIPSEFAKQSLIYLQEVGKSKSLEKHTSSRTRLDSFLFFIVLDGNGVLTYNSQTIKLTKGDCAFIDCKNKYSHTSNNWTIAWIHFNGNNVKNIYDKFISRKGQNTFKTKQLTKYESIINEIYMISNSSDYMRDMNLYDKITSILTSIMSETIYVSEVNRKHKYNLKEIKDYIDENYINNISLQELSDKFFINKFYLTRSFKDTYGTTINNYILQKKITKAKELLRFSDMNIETIANNCGIEDQNYFSRLFKKIEGITPKEYKRMW